MTTRLLAGLLSAVLLAVTPAKTSAPAEISFVGCINGSTPARTCQYRIGWADDGNGAPALLIVKDTIASLPAKVDTIQNPVSPVLVEFTWPKPAAGTTQTGTVSAYLVRRNLSGPVTELNWSYTAPDVPPPPVVIDTTLLVSAIDVKPDTAIITVGTETDLSDVQFCVFLIFRDGKVPVDNSAPSECIGQYSKWFSLAQRGVSPEQQRRADSMYAGILSISETSFLPRGTPLREALADKAQAESQGWMRYALRR